MGEIFILIFWIGGLCLMELINNFLIKYNWKYRRFINNILNNL